MRIGGTDQFTAKYDLMSGKLAKKYSIVTSQFMELGFTAFLGSSRFPGELDLSDPDVERREAEYDAIVQSLQFTS